MWGRLAPGTSRATVQTENAVPSPPALLIAMLLAVPGYGQAAPRMEWLQVQAGPTETQRPRIDRQEAAERAATATGGKVLTAEPDHVDGRLVYRVKVLTPDGHVRNVIIDAGERAGAR